MTLLDLLYIPLALVTAPFWAVKKRHGWRERFGGTAPLPHPREGVGRVLVHAVSVGEVNALRHLVPLLAREAEVVISTTTDTGLKRATELFAAMKDADGGGRGGCKVVRYPLDFSWAVRRFLDAVRPDAVALVELEVWPNFVRACSRRGVPVCIMNGRLSARSFKGYSRIRGFFGRVLNLLEFAAVQDEDYAGRFEALGLPANKCLLTGSMKWDSASVGNVGAKDDGLVAGAAELAAAMGIDRSRPLIVAGSTGPGEESLLHAACPAGVQLLCAPRKPERFEEAAAALPGCVRRTRAGANGVHREAALAGEPPVARDRFLLDTIGELRKAYSLADIVVVGRSFGDLYGSDPIEPIALGKPTVIGPAISDFAAVVKAFEDGGGIVRATRDGLGETLAGLMENPMRRKELGERGRACIRRQQGASARHAELILGMLSPGFKHGSSMVIRSGPKFGPTEGGEHRTGIAAGAAPSATNP